MTLSTFLQLLEDVDAQRAAKGSAGLMRLKPEALPQGRASLAAEDVEILLRYAQVATAAYGPALLNPAFYPEKYAGLPPPPGDVDGWLRAVRSHLPADVELLQAEPSSTWLRPAYFIGIDKRRNCAILSIRGTLSPEDLLTDLSAEEATTPWGPAHKGILLSAQALLQEVLPKLEEVLESRGVDQVVVLGHSLGAGVATYVSLLLEAARDPAGPAVAVSCYAYGSPGLAHWEAASAPGGGTVPIVSVVNGYDWISRLSYGHVIDLLDRGHKEFETMMGVVESLLGGNKETAASKAPVEAKPLPAKLYPCGKIILLLPGQGVIHGTAADVENLQLHPSMFLAHLPNNYEAELSSALARLRAE